MLRRKITVIGNVFVDIKGSAFRPVHKDAKNVGNVQIVHGGVGRNVVHNLGVLGADVRFISSVTGGGLGDEVMTALQQVGVDTQYVKGFPDSGMGLWLAVLQPDGELVVSISEQPSLDHQTEAILSPLADYMSDTGLVGLDVGISQEVIDHVKEACQKRGIPLFGVVGNLDVVERNPQALEGFDVFVCNEEEAEILAKHPVKTPESALAAAQHILSYGCRSCVVTIAEHGCVVASSHGAEHIPASPAELVDSTGAGDSFFAGVLFCSAADMQLQDAVRFASHVAAKVVSSHYNTLIDTDGLPIADADVDQSSLAH